MLCSVSSCLWRSPVVTVVLVVILMVCCIATVEAQPAGHRSEASANSGDHGLHHRRSHSTKKQSVDPPKIYCGAKLRDELARTCNGRGYNSPQVSMSGAGLRSEGAASVCCVEGCNKAYLESYCAPLAEVPSPTESSSASQSVEQVWELVPDDKQSTLDEAEIKETSNNQLRPKPQPEEPKSDDTAKHAETENAIFREPTEHNYFVKRNNYHLVNIPVTAPRQPTIL